MQITRSVIDTQAGPQDWFTGTVHIDQIAAPPSPARLRCLSVHFSPGARTAWHRHPLGQTIFVTEGAGDPAAGNHAPGLPCSGDMSAVYMS